MRALVMASVIALAVLGQARADDRKDIDALYAKLAAALKAKNPDAILALQTPDFKSKGPDGKTMTGKELAVQMKQENAAIGKVTSSEIKVKSAAIKGNTAVVTSSFVFSAEVPDPQGHMGPKGKTHTMGMTGTAKNDLVRAGGAWKFKTMEQGVATMTMDGKPMAAGGAAGKK
jgi:ketosteroid isomerase-like protein